MPVNLEVANENLLNAVVQMPESEFKRFIKKVRELRQKDQTVSLNETELLHRINTIFPTEKRRQYNELYAKFKAENITEKEHEELLKLSDEFEILNAERLKYIGELAVLRGQTLKEVIRDLGINTSQK
ncbi:MAG: hypothetical protein R2747_12555 [Pyrinomonadaceae bacterium]